MTGKGLEGWGVVDGAEAQLDAPEDHKPTEAKKKKKGSGGFQVMGLSRPVLRGVLRKGYKVPTPIQRKTLPAILEGKDVVAMARTGSGKTACFLIPMFEKLLKASHKVISGPRAIILSPTRELAMQTFKFTKELGQYTDLKVATILGGFSMEQQFAALHNKPDVIIATPGRLMHVCVEMGMKFDSISYVVFDEADRLFEMGFSEQLNEILNRLPGTRQTVLFSATLPKMLVDFARAGLSNPTLIRLDVEHILSENLKLAYFKCNSEDRVPLLLHLLQNVLEKRQQSVIFVATSHHVEYLQTLLEHAGISATYCYSALDPSARKINIAKFQNKKVQHFIVTDVAARGIDIPMLENVINFNFPAKPKIFVHRVGRVARAGRSGVAYSFVAPDETAHMQDLHMYLGKEIVFAPPVPDPNADWNDMYGTIPQYVLDTESEIIRRLHGDHTELDKLKQQMDNGYKQYIKCRPLSSKASVTRMKEAERLTLIGQHPVLASHVPDNTDLDAQRLAMLQTLKTLKPKTTIFEVNRTRKDTSNKSAQNMKEKRLLDEGKIQTFQKNIEEKIQAKQEKEASMNEIREKSQVLAQSTEEDVENAFSSIISTKKGKRKRQAGQEGKSKKVKEAVTDFKDKDFYIPYVRDDQYKEKGNSLGSNFHSDAKQYMMDLTKDEDEKQSQKGKLKWDRQRKKFVGTQDQQKKIKTESGNYIAATYKTDRYRKWLKNSKQAHAGGDGEDDEEEAEGATKPKGRGKRKGKGVQALNRKGQPKYHPLLKGKIDKSSKPPRREVKNKKEFIKAMKIRDEKFQKQQENLRNKTVKSKDKLKKQHNHLQSKLGKF